MSDIHVKVRLNYVQEKKLNYYYYILRAPHGVPACFIKVCRAVPGESSHKDINIDT